MYIGPINSQPEINARFQEAYGDMVCFFKIHKKKHWTNDEIKKIILTTLYHNYITQCFPLGIYDKQYKHIICMMYKCYDENIKNNSSFYEKKEWELTKTQKYQTYIKNMINKIKRIFI